LFEGLQGGCFLQGGIQGHFKDS